MQNLKSMNCVLLLDHEYPGDRPASQVQGQKGVLRCALAAQRCKTDVHGIQMSKICLFEFI